MVLIKKILAGLLTGSILFNIVLPVCSSAETTDIGSEIVKINFEDNNLYQAIVEILGEKISEKDDETKNITITPENLETVEKLELQNKGISDITGLEEFTNLKELIIYTNEIEDISPLTDNTSIEKIDISENVLDDEDTSVFMTMASLKEITIEFNELTKIGSLANVTTLTYLDVAYNEIQDITGINNLANLSNLNLKGNNLTQIQNLPDIENINLEAQKISEDVIGRYSETMIINLPEIFLQAQDENNEFYSQEGIEVINGTLSEDRTYVEVNPYIAAKYGASINIKSGKLKDSQVYIYGISVSYSINITPTEEEINEKYDFDLNSDGEVNEQDCEVIKKWYQHEEVTQEELDKLLKMDLYLDEKVDRNDYIRLKNYLAGESGILLTTEIGEEQKTNQEVLADVITNDIYSEIEQSYLFTQNGEHEFTVMDRNGELQSLIATVDFIDNEGIQYEVIYSTTELTTEPVTVTIKSSKTLLDIYSTSEDEELSSWILSEDKMRISKIYDKNVEDIAYLMDEAGNLKIVSINVENIYDGVLEPAKLIIEDELGETYTSGTWTNKSITIKIDENSIQEGNTVKYTINGQGEYTENTTITDEGVYEINLITTDMLGNYVNSTYTIKIDRTNPTIGTLIVKSNSATGENVENGILTVNNLYISVEDGQDEQSGHQKTIYKINDGEEHTQSQILRNSGIYEITIITYDNVGNYVEETYTYEIDKTKPELSVSYTVNQDGSITAIITSNKKLQQVDGWALLDNGLQLAKNYMIDMEETIEVTDELGNTQNITITIEGTDTSRFEVAVDYDNKSLTNDGVEVTIISNKQMQKLEGFTISSDKKVQIKKYTQNVNENIDVYDIYGDKKTISINIINIDKQAPILSVGYSSKVATNQDITVTIYSNEELQTVQGWDKAEDKYSLSKTYSSNTTETVLVTDLAGNTQTVDIDVTNIDKDGPQVTVNYSTSELTYEPVQVIITSNEPMQQVKGWTLSADNLQLMKTYAENAEETITIKDLLGNSTNANIRIQNIGNEEDISTNYELTEDGYILKIKPNTTMEQFIQELGRTVQMEYTDFVKTGMIANVGNKTYTLVVTGDINLDGTYDTIDLSKMILHIAEQQGRTLTGVALKAADVNYDGQVDIRDLSKMCLVSAELEEM